jgi:ADP-ribose pyrophosphatase YjhB (NUDIX family)
MDDRRSESARRSRSSQPSTRSKRRRARRNLPVVEEVSAGGVVVNAEDRVARIALISHKDRRGRVVWSLPKGHVEQGETFEQAAEREVFEETGVRAEVVAALRPVEFQFVADDKLVHKTVHHFILQAVGGEISNDSPEVLTAEWVEWDRALLRLAYRDERKLLRAARETLFGEQPERQ